MLCKAAYTDWDGTESRYFYTNDAQPEKRQLARIEDPGDEVTDFAYNGGRLTTVRDPLLADALRLGLAGVPNDDTTRTVVAYDSAARVASVTLPAPASGAARPGHTYQYGVDNRYPRPRGRSRRERSRLRPSGDHGRRGSDDDRHRRRGPRDTGSSGAMLPPASPSSSSTGSCPRPTSWDGAAR